MSQETHRRGFIQTAGAALAVLGRSGPLLATPGPGVETAQPEPPPHPLNLLVLGGTHLIGPHLVAYALSRGHTVTTFTRGRSKPTVHQDLFEHVEMRRTVVGRVADRYPVTRCPGRRCPRYGACCPGTR